ARAIMLDTDPATETILPATDPVTIIRTGLIGISSTGLWEPSTGRKATVNIATIRGFHERFFGPVPRKENEQKEIEYLREILQGVISSELDWLSIRMKVSLLAFTNVLFLTEEGY